MKNHKFKKILLKENLKKINITMPAICAIIISFVVITTYDMTVPEVVNAEDSGKGANELISKMEVLPNLETSTKTVSITNVDESGTYKDGVYIGTGKGFQDGTVTVQVTIKEGKIVDIKVTDYQYDGSEYIKKAEGMISYMINGQTTNVDVVSGATYSCRGIINAVRNALSKAKIGDTTSNISTNPSQGSQEDVINSLTDGIYTGTGKGFLNGEFRVQVTIKNGEITAIKVLNYVNDGEDWVNKAKGLIPLIIEQQNVKVDAVSGATYSSRGLIEAVTDALRQAATETKDEMTSDAEDTQTEENDNNSASNEEQGNLISVKKLYEGTATCTPDSSKQFSKYDITVQVITLNGKITETSRTSKIINSSNRNYSEIAEAAIFLNVISKNTIENIDTVSGATCSSKALLEAIKKALSSEPISVEEIE